jgi:tetratricopeptide (TPR) repeat protein
MVCLHLGRLEEARDYFLSAVRLAPREMAGWMGLRQLSFLKGDVESYVRSTLAVLPRLDAVAIARTCANLRYLDRLKQRDAIVEQCDEQGKKGDELDGERLLAYQGRPDKAASLPVLEMRLCAIEQPSDMLCMSLATYFGAAGQSDKARQWLARMGEQTPRSRALVWEIALQSGIFEQELPALKQYLLEQPDDYEAWFALARMHERSGNRSLAREALIRALENGFTDEQRLEGDDIRAVWEEFLRAGDALVES